MINKNVLCSLLGAVLFTSVSSAQQTETYKIDPAHSSVQFKIRHLFSKVPGQFKEFSGSIVLDKGDISKSKAEATIKTASIDTKNDQRDGHLRSPDFFDAEKHPEITFKSTAWKEVEKNVYDVTGDFTMRGVTKPVTLRVKATGAGPAMGGYRAGWEATATIDRTLWGISYNKAVEGTNMLGTDVEIGIEVEAVRQ